MREITIPGNVRRLMNNVFENCRGLKKVVLCSGVQSIGQKCFFGCTELAEVELPESLRKICMMAFGHCGSIEKIRLPEGLHELEPSAFDGCRNLKQVELPKSLEEIGSEAFGGCSDVLICTVQPGSTADKWCRVHRIRTGSVRTSVSGGDAVSDRVCPKCGQPLSRISGRCRNCDKTIGRNGTGA